MFFVYGIVREEFWASYQLSIFDPENNGADVAAFAEMWPDSIYFEAEVTEV